MIIFYSKKTGRITGSINGKFHNEIHLNMWIGDPKETERIIIEWKKLIKTEDKGEYIDFYPDHEQAELLIEIEKHPPKIHEYKIDLKTKLLIPNEN